MRLAALATAIAATALLTGCGSSADKPPAESNKPSAEAKTADCSHEFLSAAEQSFVDVAKGVPLADGAKLMRVQTSTDHSKPDHVGKVAVAIDLCGATVKTADDLRPIATKFAQAFHSSPVDDQIFGMYVSNFTTYSNADTEGEQKVKVADFQAYNWRSDVLVSPDTAWQLCPGGTCGK